jgi:hypothetical protein
MEFPSENTRSRFILNHTANWKIWFWGLMALIFLIHIFVREGSTESIGNEGVRPFTLAQWTPYPYPQPYPPPYYPPAPPDSYGGSRQARPSGWIQVEVEPQDAKVFLDGNKMETAENNRYEEGVFTGRHRIEVKKEGYMDHLEFVDVQAAVKQRLKIRLKKIK